MKIGKRDNKALQKRLKECFNGILEDAESQFTDVVGDEVSPYLEDRDDFMEIYVQYFEDAVREVYKNRAKE